jgi:hypothetical protein
MARTMTGSLRSVRACHLAKCDARAAICGHSFSRSASRWGVRARRALAHGSGCGPYRPPAGSGTTAGWPWSRPSRSSRRGSRLCGQGRRPRRCAAFRCCGRGHGQQQREPAHPRPPIRPFVRRYSQTFALVPARTALVVMGSSHTFMSCFISATPTTQASIPVTAAATPSGPGHGRRPAEGGLNTHSSDTSPDR